MPATNVQQQLERRQAIVRLLDEHEIARQLELVALLRAEGYPATQSSVSRDLRNLGAAKFGNRLPACPNAPAATPPNRLR